MLLLGVGFRFAFRLYRRPNFTSMNGNFPRCFNTETNFVSTNVNNGDNDVAIDHDPLALFPRQNQHFRSPRGATEQSLLPIR